MPEELAPPVVAVVATADPGESLEACIESLSSQDYPNLTTLVVDDGSTADLAGRVAAVDGNAIVRRRPVASGYAAASDEALRGIEGASFYLFCHDDVVLERRATRRLVEEAFRSNAGVVGPKMVDADDEEHLLQVGLGVHRLGTPAPRVRPGELDQAQHDGARDVFAVPGGCMLVRADLFEALGGFDPAMSLFGEDVDFCWRAQVAGARVTVAPQARVGHRQLAAAGRRPVADPQGLQRRHELRAALKNCSRARLPLVLLELLALGLAEMAVGVLAGERERSRRVLRAWAWNLSERASLREARRQLRYVRQVPDRELLRRMAAPSRLQRFVRPDLTGQSPRRLHQAVNGLEHALEVERVGSWWTRVQEGEVPAAQLSLAAVLVLLGLIGVRDILFSRLPLLGDLVPLASGSTLLGRYFTGISVGGLTQPAPSAFGLVGLFALLLGNSSALALKLIEVGSLALGAVGVSRLARPFLSSRGRLVAAAAFLALPLVWNDLATGDVQAAVALGAFPYVLSRLARAGGLGPYRSASAGRGRQLVGEIAPFGLLMAVTVALAPATLLVLGTTAVAVGLGTALAGRPRAALRLGVVVLGAALVAWLLLCPWSLSWFASGARWSALTGAVPGQAVTPATLLEGHLGPFGGWWGGFGIALAAGYAVATGRRERHLWASIWWMVAISAIAVAWAGSHGWIGSGGGATAVLVAPAGVALAAACGLGVVAFERDVLTHRSLGWRQAAAGLGILCLVGGALPALGAVVGGRAGLPGTGIEQTLDWTATSPRSHYRVLWLGDPRSLPGRGWQLAPGLAWYSSSRGLPGADQEWPTASPGATALVGRDVAASLHGSTAELGALLAPLGIRFLVVPTANAPRLAGTQSPSLSASPPSGLISVLEDQSDLVERPVEAGAYVFVNADWRPSDGAGRPADRSSGGGGFLPTAPWRDLGLGVALLTLLLAVAEGARRRGGGPAKVPEPDGRPPEASVRPPARAGAGELPVGVGRE